MKSLKPPHDLLELQEWMRWIVCDPRGVEGALKDEKMGVECKPEPSPRRLPSIVATLPLSPSERLAIYAEAYLARIVEALEKDFETIRKILGEATFRALCARYLLRYPSQSFTLGDCGERFASFLSESPLRDKFPYLPDLARLEWATVESFHANDLPPLERESLARLSEEDWNRAIFQLDASVKLLSFDWTVDVAYHGAEAEQIRNERNYLLIYRKENEVWLERLEELPFWLLSYLQEGKTLSAIAEEVPRILKSDPSELATHFSNYFGLWVNEGILRAIRVPY